MITMYSFTPDRTGALSRFLSGLADRVLDCATKAERRDHEMIRVIRDLVLLQREWLLLATAADSAWNRARDLERPDAWEHFSLPWWPRDDIRVRRDTATVEALKAAAYVGYAASILYKNHEDEEVPHLTAIGNLIESAIEASASSVAALTVATLGEDFTRSVVLRR
jgi:hypothetical protein